MSSDFVVARVLVGTAAAGGEVLRGSRPARGRAFSGKKKALVVVAVALLVAFATLIAASKAPNADHHSSAGSTQDQSRAAAPQMSEKEALDAYEKVPLAFVPNEGQTDEAVRYYAQGAGYGFFFTKEGARLSFADGEGRGGHALALDFLGADSDATLTARQRLAGEVNYLMGDDQAKWQQGLPTHAELLYGGLWPGIDMAVRGEGGKLKYEFHLKPGSSVKDIRLDYRGAERLSVGAGGELLVQTSLGVLKDAAPVSYQRIGGERVPVESRYTLKGDGGGYGFAVGSYDPRYPLVIDPGLDYSTFLGGTGGEGGSGIAVRDGRAYVTGETSSTDYPTQGAFDTSLDGFSDTFVTKLNASGSALAYSTYLGGTGDDEGEGIAVDGSGRAYVTGTTSSTDYPKTSGAFDRIFNGDVDAFVTKLNASGSALDYSTYLGGTTTEFSAAIAVDGMSRAHVTGQTRSENYPTTSGAFDRSFNGGIADAFVTKLNASGSALEYSTYLGGTDFDQGHGIAVNGGRAYVMGTTSSTDFRTTQGAFDRTPNGDVDAFVTKFNASGSGLEYSTYLGGTHSDEGGGDIAVLDGRAYVTGTTNSIDYPTQGAFDTSLGGFQDAFVTKFNASGSALVYSTYLGGTSGERGEGIAVDGSGRAYVTGSTFSDDYPTQDAFDTSFNGGVDRNDAFVTKFNAAGSALAYSTYLGGMDNDAGFGIAVGGSGRAYVTGSTVGVEGSSDFPTTPGAFDTTFGPSSDTFSSDAFVTKLPTA